MNDKQVLSQDHGFARFKPPIVGEEQLGAFDEEIKESILDNRIVTYEQCDGGLKEVSVNRA